MTTIDDRAAWLQGNGAPCDAMHEPPARLWRIILLGAPGIGKGTQAALLAERLGSCHLSTGDIFRAAKCLAPEQLSPVMRDALGYMRRGELVPDMTVIDMVAERLRCLQCRHGFLLDGFPRTVEQARALDGLMASQELCFDAVLSFDLDTDSVIARLSGRRTCPQCKATFHITGKPPREEGICDACGVPLYQREDDRPEAIAVRLRAYHESTTPLEEYYESQGLLRRVDAGGAPEEVFARALAALQ